MHVSASHGDVWVASRGETGPLVVRTPDFAVRLGDKAALGRHAVMACDCPAGTAAPGFDRLSLRTVRRGAEVFRLGARRVVLDEDSYLVTNQGGGRASTYVGETGVRALLVIFRPGSLTQALSAPDAESGAAEPSRECFEFLETLQAHGNAVTQQLSEIERRLHEDTDDGPALEEHVTLLLAAAIAAERETQGRESRMAAIKPATRRELLRRVLIASDFIQSAYTEPISLQDIATAAHLSPFHLVRLFQRAHGLTPHAYLTRKRLSVALRLVSQTQLGLSDIAERAGLGTRSSLFRHLRRQQGSGASVLRAHSRSTVEPGACTTRV